MKIKVVYLVEMSNRTKIPIDPDELPQVIKAIQEKSIVKVKRGIFNPAFFIDIIKDEERMYQFNRGLDDEIKPLIDVFKNAPLLESGFKKLL